MQIQVNTDGNVEGREELARQVEAEIGHTLGRFSDHITCIEVHLSDEDSDKCGRNDKRCLMEALAGRQPVAVSNHAGSLNETFGGAAENGKLKRALESALGRLKDHKRRTSIRGNEGRGDSKPAEAIAPPRKDA